MAEKSKYGSGIRKGSAYLEGLRDGREIWSQGKRVEDVTNNPTMGRAAQTLAGFLDRQHDLEFQDLVTYVDEDGHRCAMSHKPTKTAQDVIDRGAAYYEWAKWSGGMFGRTPDYKNASVMAFAQATEFLAQGTKGQADFVGNIRSFYDEIRLGDKVLTHTLVNPSVSHQQYASGKFDGQVALHVTKETDAGIVVNGARLLATLGPFADSIEVFPSTVLKADDDNIPFAFAFSIPIATQGLRMICRDTYDHGKTNFDAPLASRFDEMDAVVIFEDVLVPWERVFMYGEPALCNQAFGTTRALAHMAHQVACGKLAKAEFMVGLMCLIAKATGRDKDLHTKGMIAEVMMMAETVRALRFSAEQQAEKDAFGNYVPLQSPLDTQRNLFPKFYPRMVEILQMLGSSSLMATPAEADFTGDLGEDVERYFQLANLGPKDRTALYRLAHDVAVSGFGNRQALYERFFFGPPHLMASAYFDLYSKDDKIGRIEALLDLV